MNYSQPSFLSDQDLLNELAQSRRDVDRLLGEVKDFSTLTAAQPWQKLDHVLNELRAAATAVAVLERIVARAG